MWARGPERSWELISREGGECQGSRGQVVTESTSHPRSPDPCSMLCHCASVGTDVARPDPRENKPAQFPLTQQVRASWAFPAGTRGAGCDCSRQGCRGSVTATWVCSQVTTVGFAEGSTEDRIAAVFLLCASVSPYENWSRISFVSVLQHRRRGWGQGGGQRVT